MLGALGGLLVVSFVLVRNKRYIMGMSLLYTAIAAVHSWGVPFV